MAGASNIGQIHQRNPPSTTVLRRGISNFEDFSFNSLSPFGRPARNGDFSFTTVSQSEPGRQGFESVHSNYNSFFNYRRGEEEDDDDDDEDDDDDQMNFVTDLFGTRQGSSYQRNFSLFGSESRDRDEEPGLVLGLGSSSTIGSIGGLRVAGIDSESESEDMEIDSGVDHVQNDDLGSPDFWDALQYDGQRERGSFTDEFEWEEINIRENMTSLIDRIEQLSISSISESPPFVSEEEEENARNVEWQVLLAVNNLDPGFEYDEYNVQFGELVGEDGIVRGGPPAAKSVVESLPCIALKSNVVCAVCKDDICAGLYVTQLPCSHHYHKDCILPWLAIRNTCPLCRHELPTDDADYEGRKNGNDEFTS